MTPSVPRLLLSFLIAIAILPAVAQADSGLPQVPVPASDALTTTAHALAVAHWGAEPCAGQVTVTWAHMGAGINARSTWMSYDIHNPATYTQCAISYNLDVDWDWPKLCTVIEHELGHLAGHEHVNDPHDVMSPYYVFPSAECAAGQAGAQAVPAPVAVAQAPAAATPRTATSTRKVAKAKAKVAKRKVAKAKAKAKVAKVKVVRRKATAKSAKRRPPRPRAHHSHGHGGARAAVSADSRDRAVRFGCALVSA
jgi:hypothetical protein